MTVVAAVSPRAPSGKSADGPPPPLPSAGRFVIELLNRFLTSGRIRFLIGDAEIAAGADQGSETVLRVHNLRFFARVLRYGNLGLGEALWMATSQWRVASYMNS
jgi:hypothetical protein